MTESTGREAASRRPRIGVTIGDPAGIGPEVSLKAVAERDRLAACDPVLIGDARYLIHWARVFGLDCKFDILSPDAPLPARLPDGNSILIYNVSNVPEEVEMGREQAACGRAAAEYIRAGVSLCLAGELDALTTAPINKKALHLGGYPYPGHTEFLAELTRTEEFAMTFFSPALRVALLTTHVPLTEVAGYVRREALERLIRLMHRELTRLGITSPRIAVAALNPHGGEGMLFGSEEAREMAPAIEACREGDGIDVTGPHSGDTIFVRAARGEFDLVISCYHDQGLIPIKCMSFGEAVNVTLGLPFIRTSVDHGTAFDIAGRNRAEHGSMVAAIHLAADLAIRRRCGLTRDRNAEE